MTKIDTSTEAVEALLDGVTDGPWAAEHIKYNSGYRTTIYPEMDPLNAIAIAHWHSVKTETGEKTDRQENARFIAASRELVPALLAERDALQAKLAKAVGAMAKAHAIMRECGWHLAPAAEPESDGVLELAVCEIEAEFEETLAELTGGKDG